MKRKSCIFRYLQSKTAADDSGNTKPAAMRAQMGCRNPSTMTRRKMASNTYMMPLRRRSAKPRIIN